MILVNWQKIVKIIKYSNIKFNIKILIYATGADFMIAC